MPADCEMLVARSNPVFSHKPPGPEFLASLTHLHYRPPSPRRRQNTPSPPPLSMPVAVPRRPCLVVRPEDTTATAEENGNDLLSPTKLKKKVVFADDKGLSLTQVRLMTEPSNVPPMWSFQFLAQVTKGISAEVAPEPWEVTFSQPASDYVDFRNRLDTRNVSLENVIVRESEQAVVGTVKVRNISFHKEVIVRSSSDDWTTHEDAFCTYVENNAQAPAAYVLYDTFSFRLTLPPRARRIEFCVCFRCEGSEFWDNNTGKNYVLVKKPVMKPVLPVVEPAPALSENKDYLIHRSASGVVKCSDAVHAKLDSWSEFASWNHLDTAGPYW